MSAILKALGAAGKGLQGGLRFAAKVPVGQKFFSGPTMGTGRLLRLGFSPHMGKLNPVKHTINATSLGGLLYSGYRGYADKFQNAPVGRWLEENTEQGKWAPLAAAGEMAEIDTIPELDVLPDTWRGKLRSQARGLAGRAAAEGFTNGLQDFSKLHPQQWAGKKWAEPFKMLASPMAKPTAAAFNAMQRKRDYLNLSSNTR